MWILALAAGMLTLIMANSFFTEYMAREVPWNANEIAADAGKFHAFAAAAEIYMRDHASDTSFVPSGTTAVYWETSGSVVGLKNARGLPPGLKNANIDANWRVQIVTGGYILCTQMSSGGAVKMARLPESLLWNPSIPWQQGNVTFTSGSTSTPGVTFDVDAAKADVCK